jgi:hypothetical protein
MHKFTTSKFTFVAILIVFLIIIGAGLFYLGDQYALNRLSIRQVTPTQLANAMQQDSFYSDFRENTVIFNGQVTKVTPNGSGVQASIKTSSTYSLACDMPANKVKAGIIYRFASEAYQAERQSSGVLLPNCYVSLSPIALTAP